jgi:hypothetical protein
MRHFNTSLHTALGTEDAISFLKDVFPVKFLSIKTVPITETGKKNV